MNKRLRDIAIKAGYESPELEGRLNTFTKLLMADVLKEISMLHLSQTINNQNHANAWHDGVDSCIETLREEYGDQT